jgi:hypothetical protein
MEDLKSTDPRYPTGFCSATNWMRRPLTLFAALQASSSRTVSPWRSQGDLETNT